MAAVYVDFEHSGTPDQQGNIPVLKDQAALSNAVKLWVCSFRGERLYRPTKGGLIVGSLFKPMSRERANEIEKDIRLGLRSDFRPSVIVSSCTVTPDYENYLYYIHIEGSCPVLKAAVYTDTVLKSLYEQR